MRNGAIMIGFGLLALVAGVWEVIERAASAAHSDGWERGMDHGLESSRRGRK